MGHWKICSKSWEGQNSMKAKIWGSKFYFFLVEPLVKILCSLKRGVKILYFFPVPWKRGVKTAEPTNQLHWRGPVSLESYCRIPSIVAPVRGPWSDIYCPFQCSSVGRIKQSRLSTRWFHDTETLLCGTNPPATFGFHWLKAGNTELWYRKKSQVGCDWLAVGRHNTHVTSQ